MGRNRAGADLLAGPQHRRDYGTQAGSGRRFGHRAESADAPNRLQSRNVRREVCASCSAGRDKGADHRGVLSADIGSVLMACGQRVR
jgi:hypothetical protein